MSQNRRAFLDMLAVSEGTSTNRALTDKPHPLSVNDGYDVIVSGVNGPEVFTDYRQHPFVGRVPKQVNTRGLYSTASGRYQHMRVHWPHYKALLNLAGFGPISQDLWAIQLIRERGALQLIDAGQFDLAVARVRNLWASLPGAGYGQPEHGIAKLRTAYLNAGGTLA